MTTLTEALKIAGRGIPIVLMEAGTKACKVENWQNIATTNANEITKQAGERRFNYACVAKAGSGGFLFLDDDNDIRQEYEKVHGPLPATLKLQSCNGSFHYYFRHSAASLAYQQKIGKAFIGESNPNGEKGELWSLRMNNAYVIGPGSSAPDKQNVESEWTVVWDAPIIEIPDTLLRFLADRYEKNRAPENASNEPEEIIEGGRNKRLASIAGKLRNAGLDGDAILAALLHHNENCCIPPLPRSEVETIAGSISRYPVGKDTRVLFNGKEGGAESLTSPNAQKVETTQELIDQNFPAYDGKPPEKPEMLIEGFLMRGVNFFGSLSGIGKSWAALAVAKCLTTGEPLFGAFPVSQIMPVLYLIPESDEAGFKYRLGVIGMGQNAELFRYRTISQGKTLSLVNDLTLATIRHLHHDGKYPRVLVIVDTAVRFMVTGKDMNSATNNTLSNDAETLRSPEVGADILFLHHSPKAASKQDMTLENVLRDTGDFGAMADAVYGLRRDEKLFDYGDGPEEVEIINVKMRAPERPKPFRIRLKRKPEAGEGSRPISVIGCAGGLPCVDEQELSDDLAERVGRIIANNPEISYRGLKEELRIHHSKIQKLAESRGWRQRVRSEFDSKSGKTIKHFYWSQIVGSDTAVSGSVPEVIQ